MWEEKETTAAPSPLARFKNLVLIKNWMKWLFQNFRREVCTFVDLAEQLPRVHDNFDFSIDLLYTLINF